MIDDARKTQLRELILRLRRTCEEHRCATMFLPEQFGPQWGLKIDCLDSEDTAYMRAYVADMPFFAFTWCRDPADVGPPAGMLEIKPPVGPTQTLWICLGNTLQGTWLCNCWAAHAFIEQAGMGVEQNNRLLNDIENMRQFMIARAGQIGQRFGPPVFETYDEACAKLNECISWPLAELPTVN